MSNYKLECPYCKSTLSIDEWNKSIEYSIRLGVANEYIPEFNSVDEFRKYKIENEGVRMDCPECDEVVLIDDMDIY